MLVRFVLSMCCLLFTASQLWAQNTSADKQRPLAQSSINKKYLDPKLDVEKWVRRFEGEKREIAANRQEVVRALKLGPGATVADVGAGTGLFLEPFSAAVTGKGKVYALDISPGFVKHLRKRVEEKGLRNVEAIPHSTHVDKRTGSCR